MIKIENVNYKYNNSENQILNNLNFMINDGEIVAIVGENGSGKSTIAKLISGILKLKQGKITIDGLDVSDRKNKVLHDNIGIVFQNPENQIIFNNIYDELSFSLKDLDKIEKEKRIEESLKKVGMISYKENDLYTLSLGQKQRIMIAEMLVKKPKYIVLDEPTTMIDPIGKEEIYKIIENLKNEGYTIICITNVADEILIADRTLILKNGSIEAEIKREELLEKIHILKENNIKLPTILEIIDKLKNQGINLKVEKFTIDELVNELEGILKNE